MEFRLAIRRLRRRLPLTIVSILTLGCAVGAATAAWSVLGALFFHPLAIPHPSALFVVSEERLDGPTDAASFLFPDVEALRGSSVMQKLAFYGDLGAAVRTASRPERVPASFVSANFFEVVGVAPAIGRAFAAGEDRRGAPVVVILSDRYWKRALNADRAAVGRQLRVGDVSATIVGVAPPDFRGLALDDAPDLYFPVGAVEQVVPHAMNYFADALKGFSPSAWLHAIGRGPSGGAAVASARLGSLLRRPARATPLRLVPADVAAVPAAARSDIARIARLLAATTGLLLVIGSLTVGTLLLVRTEARREEFAMRLALGDSRIRMAGGVAIEAALLAAGGAMLSWPMAKVLLRLVQDFELPGRLAIAQLAIQLDRGAFLTAAASAVVAAATMALVAGAFSFAASLDDLHAAKSGATAPITRRRTRTALVIAQVAAAMLLLCGAGLFARSLAAVFTLNPAIDAAHTLTTSISLGRRFWPLERSEAYYADVLEKLQHAPSVDAIGSTMNGISMSSEGMLSLDGAPLKLAQHVDYLAVDAGYLPALGLRVTAGRNFTDDDSENAPRVALVSASLAARLADAQGRVIGRTFSEALVGRTDEIVGIVPDVVTDVRRTSPLLVYQPIAQQPHNPYRTFLIRARNPALAARDASAILHAFDAEMMATPVETIDDGMLAQLAPQRFGLSILGVLGAIAVLLTLLGAYVLAESMVAVRRREMGIRSALGGSVFRLASGMMGETAILAGAGVIVGLGLVWLAAGTIRALLFQTAPLDPATLAAVALTILVLTFAVSLRPALRAARVDLASVLREN